MLGLLPAAASAALATFAVAAAAPSSPSTTTTISPASSPALNSSSPTLNMSSSTQTILMGSYSSAGAHVVYFTPPASANGTDGKLELGPSLFLGERASWIAQHPTEKDVVYAVLEAEPQDGQIVQARLGQDAKTVEVEGTKSTLGAAPCVAPLPLPPINGRSLTILRACSCISAHCAVIANGKALAVANYAGASHPSLGPVLSRDLPGGSSRADIITRARHHAQADPSSSSRSTQTAPSRQRQATCSSSPTTTRRRRSATPTGRRRRTRTRSSRSSSTARPRSGSLTSARTPSGASP